MPLIAGTNKPERPVSATSRAVSATDISAAANSFAAQGLAIVFDGISKFIGLIGQTGDAFASLTPHVAVVTCAFLLGAFALIGAFFLLHRQQTSDIYSQALEREYRANESRARQEVR